MGCHISDKKPKCSSQYFHINIHHTKYSIYVYTTDSTQNKCLSHIQNIIKREKPNETDKNLNIFHIVISKKERQWLKDSPYQNIHMHIILNAMFKLGTTFRNEEYVVTQNSELTWMVLAQIFTPVQWNSIDLRATIPKILHISFRCDIRGKHKATKMKIAMRCMRKCAT